MLQATNIERQGQTTTISIHFPLLGIATLVLILMLGLKDELVAHDELAAGRSVQQALMPETSPQNPEVGRLALYALRERRRQGISWITYRWNLRDSVWRLAMWPAKACQQPC